jgi:hypothetical protein
MMGWWWIGAALAQHHAPAPAESSLLLNGIEVATGLVAAVMSFQAALAYREGLLGKGVTWVSVGMVLMAVGHLVLVIRRVAGVDPFAFAGQTGSFVLFSLAVFASFGASAFGFYLIRGAATAGGR